MTPLRSQESWSCRCEVGSVCRHRSRTRRRHHRRRRVPSPRAWTWRCRVARRFSRTADWADPSARGVRAHARCGAGGTPAASSLFARAPRPTLEAQPDSAVCCHRRTARRSPLRRRARRRSSLAGSLRNARAGWPTPRSGWQQRFNVIPAGERWLDGSAPPGAGRRAGGRGRSAPRSPAPVRRKPTRRSRCSNAIARISWRRSNTAAPAANSKGAGTAGTRS